MRVLHAPTLGWRNVDVRDLLVSAIGLPVHIENSGRACALAQLWAMHGGTSTSAGDFVFVSVSDGLGLGVIVRGELLRGRHNVAGEFGHVPLTMDGPRCSCGAIGCWEAYVSNRATLARYFGRPAESDEPVPADERAFTVEDLISRARRGDAKARAAIQATGRYLGAGLVSVVNVFDPTRVYVGGEITAAWDLIEDDVRTVVRRARADAGGGGDGDSGRGDFGVPAPAGRGSTRHGAGVCGASRGVRVAGSLVGEQKRTGSHGMTGLGRGQRWEEPMNTVHTVDDVEKRAAMEQVLQSATFVRASQVRNFLRYICEMELAGRASALHEYLIAVEAMGLPSSYSTDDDSSVRRRAYALRQKLDRVYADELTEAKVRIEVPKGSYVPRFVPVEAA